MKKIVLLLIVLARCLTVNALSLTPEQALQRACGEINAPKLSQSGQRQWLLVMTLGRELFVFGGAGGKGYMVVPADDRVTPVLAWSDEASIDPAHLPDNMAWWLEQYRHEVQCVVECPELSRHLSGAEGVTVPPLLTSKWNQNSPYCNQCPTYSDGGNTYKCATGCVATAMAQVMYYHRWPVKGTGAFSYRATVGNTTKQLTVYFNRSTYHWEQMLDRYDDTATEEARSAVAKLMYDVAVACQMSFGLVSSSSMARPVHALRTYFGYSQSLQARSRDLTPLDQWEQMLRDELVEGRPVLYGGVTPTAGGHAFVVDGCRSDGYFHINWGWGGMSDGWYLMTALNPESQGIGSFVGGYNMGQIAIVGIKPDAGEPAVSNLTAFAQDFSPTVSATTLGQEVGLEMQMYAVIGNGRGVDPFQVRLGVNVYDSRGELVQTTVTDSEQHQLINGSFYLSRTLAYTPATDLPDGTYRIWPAFAVGNGETLSFSPPLYAPGYVTMTVSGAQVALAEERQPGLLVGDNLQMGVEQCYVGRPVPVEFTLRNAGQTEYYGNVYAAFLDSDTIVTSSALHIDLMPDAVQSHHAEVAAPSVEGDYVLALVDRSHQPIATAGVVHVAAADDALLTIAQTLAPDAAQMPASHIGATATVANYGGPFMGRLQMFVMPQAANTILKVASSDFLTIDHGETRQVRFDTSFEGVIGGTYRLNLRDYARPDANYLWGSAVSFVVCDEPTAVAGDVTGDGVVDIADVNAIINVMLGKAASDATADVTADGTVDIADVNAVINSMLGK